MFLILPHTDSTYKIPIMFFSLLPFYALHTYSFSQDAASHKSTAVSSTGSGPEL